MNIYLFIIIIIAIVAILALLYFCGYTKLKKYKEKMEKAENIINENLNKKLDLIVNINTEVKKVTGKKDYLKEYTSIKDLSLTNIEKDMKLDDAEKLINDLINDFIELRNNSNFNKNIKSLREVQEALSFSKKMFNQNALLSNQLIKKFPNNVIAKIGRFKIKSLYTNNKTDGEDTF